MEVGFDGANSIIDATGTSTDPALNRLLINYYCGKDVFICTGNSGGNIALGGNNSIVTIGVDPYNVNHSNLYKLYVADGIRTEKIKVDSKGNWPDYVFHKDYKLMPLSELKEFINQFGHLPEVPTESEVKANGIDVAGFQSLLLQKIEELTLYVIELKNENQLLNKKIKNSSK